MAQEAGVAESTVRKWRERELITPVDHDERGRALFSLPDVARAERRTRYRGRRRKFDIAERVTFPEPPPPPGFDRLLNRARKAMADYGEGAEAATQAAVARIATRGIPEGHAIRNLRSWTYSLTLEELRATLIDVIIRELAERAAGEIRPYLPHRRPDEDDKRVDWLDLAS